MLLPDIAKVFPARYPLPVFIEKHPRFHQSLSAPPESSLQNYVETAPGLRPGLSCPASASRKDGF